MGDHLPKHADWNLLRMILAADLPDQIAKAIINVVMSYGCEIFRDVIAHLQRPSSKRVLLVTGSIAVSRMKGSDARE